MLIHKQKLPSPGAGEDEEEVECFARSPRHLNMTIRLLNDSILSAKLSNEMKLETIHKGFLATIDRRKELLEQIKQLNKQCQILHEQNQTVKENHQNRLRLNEQQEKNYQQRILDERSAQEKWKSQIEAFEKQSP